MRKIGDILHKVISESGAIIVIRNGYDAPSVGGETRASEKGVARGSANFRSVKCKCFGAIKMNETPLKWCEKVFILR